MVGFSERSLVANLKNSAHRPIRKERIVANQHATMADEAEQSQRTPPVAQHFAATVEVEQSQLSSTASQPLPATAEAEQSTSSAAQHLSATSD